MAFDEEQLGEVYQAIKREVIWLHAYDEACKELFSHGEHVDLWNKSCRFMGRVIHQSLIDVMTLMITRICDPAMQGNKKTNLTLERLIDALPCHPTRDIALELTDDLAKLWCDIEILRDHRNKRIAHLDLEAGLDPSTLPPFFLKTLHEAVQGIGAFIQRIDRHYLDVSSTFVPIVSGGADTLMYYLKQARKLSRLQDAVWMSGTTRDEIFEQLRNRGVE